MKFKIPNDAMEPLDAHIEIGPDHIILQSRGGTLGSSKAKNTDYSEGLKILLCRLKQNKACFTKGYVDSSKVQSISVDQRVVVSQNELDFPANELFTLISRRIRQVGKPLSEVRPTGNANKRLRFNLHGVTVEQIRKIAMGNVGANWAEIAPELSDEDMRWTEGKLRLVTHLRRERARGLSRKKKALFKQQHGKLFCEMCNLDPVASYADKLAESCIEVHHHKTAVSDMSKGHQTTPSDLQCLCANCHRLVHMQLKAQLQ